MLELVEPLLELLPLLLLELLLEVFDLAPLLELLELLDLVPLLELLELLDLAPLLELLELLPPLLLELLLLELPLLELLLLELLELVKELPPPDWLRVSDVVSSWQAASAVSAARQTGICNSWRRDSDLMVMGAPVEVSMGPVCGAPLTRQICRPTATGGGAENGWKQPGNSAAARDRTLRKVTQVSGGGRFSGWKQPALQDVRDGHLNPAI